MRQNKFSGETTLPIAGLRGLLSGFALILVLLAVATFFVSGGKIPESTMSLVTCACAFLGSLTGSLIAARSHAHRRSLVGTGNGLAMFLVCFVISAISQTGKFPSSRHLIFLAVFLVSGSLGGILAVHSPKRRR